MQQIATQDQDFDREVQNELARLARAELCTRLLERRFGELPDALFESLGHLTMTQAEEFVEALSDFQSVNDAKAWVDKIASQV